MQDISVQVVYKPRHFSYDLDWLEAFQNFAGAELVSEPQRLDADLIVIHHSMNGQWSKYPAWLVDQCLSRRGKLVIFHTNEFKAVKEREDAAKYIGADFIATQLEDGRLYEMPVISMPHALNERVFRDFGKKRPISFGFRGARYKKGIHDARNAIVDAFSGVDGSDIVLDKDSFYNRDEWAEFLNQCKAIPGAEAGNEGARIISPRHLEAIGCGTLQVLLPGKYCNVIDDRHYLPFTTVSAAWDVVNDEKKRKSITDCALEHVLAHHTYKKRIETLLLAVFQ